MDRKKVPVEVGVATAGLLVDLIFAVIVSFIIAFTLSNVLGGSLFFGFIGAFSVQIIINLFKTETRKNIRIIRYWFEYKTPFPDWAYDTTQQKSSMSLINTMEGRIYKNTENPSKEDISPNTLKDAANKSLLDD